MLAAEPKFPDPTMAPDLAKMPDPDSDLNGYPTQSVGMGVGTISGHNTLKKYLFRPKSWDSDPTLSKIPNPDPRINL